MVFALADVLTCVELVAALTDDDLSRKHVLVCESHKTRIISTTSSSLSSRRGTDEVARGSFRPSVMME